MYALRILVACALCVLAIGIGSGPARAQLPASSEPTEIDLGTLHVVLFGPGDRALAGVDVEVGAERARTNADGAADVRAPSGTRRVRLIVPHALVPEAPSGDGPWVVDLPDVAVVGGETTELIVTLTATGALVGLDLQAPEEGRRSLRAEFERARASRAQGTLRGRVVASEGAGPIAGAHVYVRGAPVDATSDADGRFTLALPEGQYALSVIHPKFSTQSVGDVTITGGSEQSLEVALSPASVELDELVVTAPHIEGGIASLIGERRETSAVADVIGAEQMARSGDSSAASALARVTGLTVIDGRFVIVRGMGERYSSMTLNRLQVPSPEPTRRVVPLDMFPAGMLESVLVQKTYSPDLPGEFGGGLVQVRSRSYPDELVLNLTLSTAYNTQTHFRDNLTYSGGRSDFLGFDDGTRALPRPIRESEKLELSNIFSAPGQGYTPEQLEALGESLPRRYATRKERTPPDLGLVASVGDKLDLRFAKLGYVAALGYKNEYAVVRNAISRTVRIEQDRAVIADDYLTTNAQRQVSVSGFLDWGLEFSDAQRLKFTTMLLRQTDDATTLRTGYDADLTSDTRTTRLSFVERQVLLQQVHGEHRLARLHDLQLDWRYAFAQAGRNEPDRRDYQYAGPRGAGDFMIVSGGGANQRLWGELDDRTHEGALDLTQPIDIWADLTAKLKVGGFVYGRRREAWVRRFEYSVSGLGPEESRRAPERIFTPENIGARVRFSEVSLANDTYDASMDLQAGYGMLELPLLPSLELMGGARVEHARIEVSTFDQFAPDAPPELAKLDDVDLLPAATLTWRVLDDAQVRLGYSRTLNRPDLRELSSGRFKDVELNAVFIGAKDLERATIDNYDLRLEYYHTSDEVFSVGGFLKQFDHPIEASIQPGAEIVYSFINSPRARTMGIELEGRKRFDFLHGDLDALYLAANFALIESEVELPIQRGGVYKRPLQSQSPWVVNAQLGWDDTSARSAGLAASLVYNVAGRRIRAVGDPNMNVPDQYEEPFHRLDLVMTQSLPHGLKLGVKAQNILNAVQVWKQGDVTVRRFRRGVDVAASLAWSY